MKTGLWALLGTWSLITFLAVLLILIGGVLAPVLP